jgi:DNA-binding NtrC family response regulator
VRELRNMLEQTVLLTQDRVITPAQLALSSSLAPDAGNCQHTGACGHGCMAPPKNGADLAHIERNLVIKTLEKTGWNVTRSAKMLGLSRDMMRYRIDKMGLSRPADEPGSGFGPD